MENVTVASGSKLKVSTPALPHQQIHGEKTFPFYIRCESPDATRSDAEAWVADQRQTLLKLASIHGAVLFRNFPLATAEDFDAFVVALGVPNFPYKKSLSNAVRVNRTE